MATRAKIALKITNTDGSVGYKTVTVTYDGYPQYLGKILERYYTTFYSVNNLVLGGDIIYIDEFGVPTRAADTPPAQIKPSLKWDKSDDWVYVFRSNGTWEVKQVNLITV